jgi:L-threonylcarbamoyladenylate synthase
MALLDGNQTTDIQQAAQLLAQGRLLGMPTETVYGLAANATDALAVAQIFSTKGRPSDHPLIVHVADADDAGHFAKDIPAFAHALMRTFWPGPLTLILPRKEGVASAAAGGQNSIGLRCPAHPVAHALLLACRTLGVQGLAAPSANRFGRVSPTTAQHVCAEFPELNVLQGGPCAVGIESTIVDCTRSGPVILRPGMITRDQIEGACGMPLRPQSSQPAPKASGTLEAHYAPHAKVRLMHAQQIDDALQVLLQTPGFDPRTLGIYSRTRPPHATGQIHFMPMPDDPACAAAELFAKLREFDGLGVGLLWVEQPPSDLAWEGIADRLRRAQANA